MSLELAIKHAIKNPIKDLPRRAAVIKDGKRLISIGYNKRKSHTQAYKVSRDSRLCLYPC